MKSNSNATARSILRPSVQAFESNDNDGAIGLEYTTGERFLMFCIMETILSHFPFTVHLTCVVFALASKSGFLLYLKVKFVQFFCKNCIWKKDIVITFLCFRCYLEFYIQRAQYLKKAFHSLMFFFLWPSLSRRLIIAFSLGYQQPQHCWEQDWQRNFTVCERWRPLEHRRSNGKRYVHFAA